MNILRLTACLWAGSVVGSALLAGAETTSPASSTDAAILERLAALERRFDELAAENKALREQLNAAQAAKPEATAVAATPTPAPAPKSEPAPAAKPAAVFIAAAGKEEKVTLGGFLQVHAETGDAPDARWAGMYDRFFIRRARLTLAGTMTDDFSFKVEGEFGNNSVSGRSGYSAQLNDGYITWAHFPALNFKAGQYKAPFGYEQLMSDVKLPMVERALASERLTPSRQIGAGILGELVPKRLSYAAGVFNGNGSNNGNNDNDDFLYAGRLIGTLVRGGSNDRKYQLDAGLSAFTMETTGATVERSGLGADLQFSWSRATLTAELLTNEFTPSTGAAFDADGWALFASWAFDKHWQITGRLESYDPSSVITNDETDSWTLGGSYLINGDNLKLTLNYIQGAVGNRDSNARILSRLQIMY